MKEMAAAYNTQEGFFRKLCIIVFQVCVSTKTMACMAGKPFHHVPVCLKYVKVKGKHVESLLEPIGSRGKTMAIG